MLLYRAYGPCGSTVGITRVQSNCHCSKHGPNLRPRFGHRRSAACQRSWWRRCRVCGQFGRHTWYSNDAQDTSVVWWNNLMVWIRRSYRWLVRHYDLDSEKTWTFAEKFSCRQCRLLQEHVRQHIVERCRPRTKSLQNCVTSLFCQRSSTCILMEIFAIVPDI